MKSRPGARIARLGGGIKKFGGAQKVQCSKFERVDQKTKVFIANFHEFWGENQKIKQKKVFIAKNAQISTIFGVESRKKGLFCKICEKSVPAHEFWGDNQYFESLRPQTALQWQRVCYFFGGTILAWGVQFSFGVHGPGRPPP